MKTEKFAIVPREFGQDRRLSSIDKSVLFAIFGFRRSADDWDVWPSRKAISERAGGYDVATVSRSITHLKALGWLAVRQTRGTSRYTLMIPETVTGSVTVSDLVTVTESGINTVTGSVTANSDGFGHTEEIKQQEIKEEKNSSSGIEPRSGKPTAVPSLSGSATQTRRTRKEPAFTSEDMAIAEWMLGTIREAAPKFGKRTNLSAWADEVRLLRTRDERSPEEIRDLFSWAQRDSFWRSNILSPGKLREKWDALEIKRGASGKANPIVQADDWQQSEQWRGVL